MAHQPDATEQLAYDINGAADTSQTGRTTVSKEIKEGRLKARKVGRKTIITREDLKAWLDTLPVRQPGKVGRRGERKPRPPAPRHSNPQPAM